MRRLAQMVLSLSITLMVGLSLVPTASVLAADPCTGGSVQSGVQCVTPPGSKGLFGANSFFTSIADTLLFIVGAISVIMIIIGGLRYVISNGNASAVEGAKNTILFAVIGLVIAALAFAIVNFVIVRL